jgi:glycosyltransferase involved in cell wall biosynthesis
VSADNRSISFIIPVKNGAKFIASCLEHISAEMHQTDEIILVDNGSTDDTIQIARSSGRNLTVLEHPRITVAALRNRGASGAKGELLAFIDSDCLLQPGWRAAVISTLADPAVHATGSICDLPANPTWVERSWSVSKTERVRKVEYIPSANLIIRRGIFAAMNGFDESLITDEDYDIGKRIVLAGGVVLDVPQIRAIHLGNSKTIAQFIRRQNWHAISILDSLRKNGWDKPMIMTLAFMGCCILALAAIVLGCGIVCRVIGPVALVLVIPVLTTVYRVMRNGDALFIPHLILLYTIFYAIRSYALLKALLIPKTGKSAGGH